MLMPIPKTSASSGRQQLITQSPTCCHTTNPLMSLCSHSACNLNSGATHKKYYICYNFRFVCIFTLTATRGRYSFVYPYLQLLFLLRHGLCSKSQTTSYILHSYIIIYCILRTICMISMWSVHTAVSSQVSHDASFPASGDRNGAMISQGYTAYYILQTIYCILHTAYYIPYMAWYIYCIPHTTYCMLPSYWILHIAYYVLHEYILYTT